MRCRVAPRTSGTTASSSRACRASRSSPTAACTSAARCRRAVRASDQPKTIETEVGELKLTEVTPAAFSCPCHGGAYDTEGNRTAGPPVRALDRYVFSIEDDRLYLGVPYSVAYVKGEGSGGDDQALPARGAGHHVDGFEAWLYPIQPSQVSS